MSNISDFLFECILGYKTDFRILALKYFEVFSGEMVEEDNSLDLNNTEFCFSSKGLLFLCH